MNIKEILVLHHSHLDVGYTHSQPILWELQREFIDQALRLLDETADWPEPCQPRWTIEVTAQIQKWLETASASDVNKMKACLQAERIGISAMQFNTTPLCNAEQLIRQLYPVKMLREKFGIAIRTANQHDVNGIPWALSDILVDSGIELLIMAVNPHFGGSILDRPGIFRWQTPGGRELLVKNGAHYTMFDQLLETHKNDLSAMEAGLNKYLTHLEQRNYSYDFLYLTAAHAPVSYDNSSPNPDVARLIRRWNEEKGAPLIRFVTPGMLLKRIEEIPRDKLPLYSGDWTDYWNFGAASTARVLAVNQRSKPKLAVSEVLAVWNGNNSDVKKKLNDDAWFNINCFDEHTWGAFNSLQKDHPQVLAQAAFKDILAYRGRELSQYLLFDELEKLADNPECGYDQEGILLVNSGPGEKEVYVPVPDWWKEAGKRHRTARLTYNQYAEQFADAPLYGPVKLAPFSWRKLSFSELNEVVILEGLNNQESIVFDRGVTIDAPNDESPRQPVNLIESPFYRLEYNPRTGRILGLWDKQLDRQVLDLTSQWSFFQLVREIPDPLFDGDRKAMYNRAQYKEIYDQSCWNYDWVARREGADVFDGFETKKAPDGISLIRRFKGPNEIKLEQVITLPAQEGPIQLTARLELPDYPKPEALYFAFPLQLTESWHGHFDSVGVVLELDREQLPEVSRGWVTVESHVAIHDDTTCYSLYCPEAPLVQVGDFTFGREIPSIPRPENPLLLAWPVNNYWDTNFRASQPGSIELKYGLSITSSYDPAREYRNGKAFATPVEIHPVIALDGPKEGCFVECDQPELALLHLKPAEDGRGIIIRAINQSDTASDAELDFGQGMIKSAWLTSPLEDDIQKLEPVGRKVKYRFESWRITSLRIIFKQK